LIFAQLGSAMTPRSDPQTGKVRVLYIGEPVGGPGPYRFMEQDPFLSMTPVQATTAWYGIDVIKRSLRMYLPRSYHDLVDRQDIIILSDANRQLFSPTVLGWFRDAVVKDGMGLLMTGGRESFGAYFGMPDWTPTPVGQILPVEATRQEKGPDGKVRILKPRNVFISSLPWSSIGRYGYFFGCNPVVERQGSEVLGELVPASGEANPLLVWWDVGEGRTFAMTADWTPAGANLFLNWEFYPDYAVNLMLFIADQKIPPDALQVHRIRSALDEFHLKRRLLLSTIDFVSRLGANPSKVDTILSQAEEGLKDVERLYTSYDFDGSIALANDLLNLVDEASEMALKLKDQAMMWIYFVEWTVITGTSMLISLVVWSLMIRRSLYKEVGVTRAA